MTHDEIFNIYMSSSSKMEMARKFGITKKNTNSLTNDLLKILSLIGIHDSNKISQSYLNERKIKQQKQEYYKNPKVCEFCGEQLPFEKRFSKCCNQSCGSSLGNTKRKLTNETKHKISYKVKEHYISSNTSKRNLIRKYQNNDLTFDDIVKLNPNVILICDNCKKQYIPTITSHGRISYKRYCSDKCMHEMRSQKLKDARKQEIDNGTFKGWINRNTISYAERFWIEVLDNHNIHFEREYKVYKKETSSYYFLDFYIKTKSGRKIDLEIDGKQHTYSDRITHDKIRDSFLISEGFEVYRIPWNEINTEEGSFLMKQKIQKFIDYLYSF